MEVRRGAVRGHGESEGREQPTEHPPDLVATEPPARAAGEKRRVGPEAPVACVTRGQIALELAARLPDAPGVVLRGPTYHAIFALLYGLGLRVGEVCRLDVADVDRSRQLLVIRDTKFGKDRLVPFGPRLGAMLEVIRPIPGSAALARHRPPHRGPDQLCRPGQDLRRPRDPLDSAVARPCLRRAPRLASEMG